MLSTLITLSPFLALPYIITAVIQKMRGNRTGFWGTLLAYVAVIAPLTALALDTVNALYQPLLPAAILANAVIVLVISLVILVLDYRRPERDLNHSYGLLGLGAAALLMLGAITTPLILSLIPGGASSSTQTTTTTDAADSSLQNVLTQQTGLSIEEIQNQMSGGTSLAALVESGGGSVEAVVTALMQAINQGIEAGTIPQPMLQRMGGDAATVASQIVSGDIPPQMAGGILGMFIGQGAALPGPGAGGFPGGAQTGAFDGAPDSAAPAMNADSPAQSSMESAGSSDNSAAPSSNRQSRPDNQPAAASEAASPTPAPTFTRTPTEIAPELAVQTSEPTVPPTATAMPPTCSLVVNFNLNLRAQPDSEADIITTIPFGSVVQTTGQNAGWWQVSYGRQSGWVSGEYVTPGTGCAALPVQ